MAELLVLADDFTGALDTAAQFSRQSIPTLVSTRIETLDQGGEEEDFSVLVLDLETRHLAPAQAAARVRQAVRRSGRTGVGSFYKKTDSTLRGNIGSELAALLEATGSPVLAFIPAYPENRRITVSGNQYVDGVPLHLSAYAADPQNPVRSSYIPKIIAGQSSTAVEVIENSDDAEGLPISRGENRIVVFDARTDEDLRRIAEQLRRVGLLRVTAGCAGFAAQLPRALALKRRAVERLECPSQLFVVCGSTNPASLEQIETAVQNGMKRIVLEPEHLLGRSSLPARIDAIVSEGSDLILQTARAEEGIRRTLDYARRKGLQAQAVPRLVARGLGHLIGGILRSRPGLTPVVFGGDTALGIVKGLGAGNIIPIGQIAPGIVLSGLTGLDFKMPLISKAGGFGTSEVIRQIRDFVRDY